MTDSPVLLEATDGVATITLNRPDAMNSLDVATKLALLDAVRQVADESELLLLAVLPEARGRGIGSRLLQRFVDDGSRAGLKKLHLEVRDGNDAVALYRRHDFTVEGRRSNYYKGTDGQVRDALTMVRFL